MGERFPAVTDKDVIKVLGKIDFEFYRQAKGSHEIWRRKNDKKHTTLPRHPGKILKRRTLKSILCDIGLSIEGFKTILK